MGTLEQIQKLDSKVQKTIEMIKALKAENLQIKKELEAEKEREEELENIVSSLKNGNREIEDGIAYAIELLDGIENQSQVFTAPSAAPISNAEESKQEISKPVLNDDETISIDIAEEETEDEENEADSGSKEQLDIF